jgi:hypothetical protein
MLEREEFTCWMTACDPPRLRVVAPVDVLPAMALLGGALYAGAAACACDVAAAGFAAAVGAEIGAGEAAV